MFWELNYYIKDILYIVFVINLIALAAGYILGRLGYTKVAKILSVISLIGVSIINLSSV